MQFWAKYSRIIDTSPFRCIDFCWWSLKPPYSKVKQTTSLDERRDPLQNNSRPLKPKTANVADTIALPSSILDIHPPISVWSILDALSPREIRVSARVQRSWRGGFPLGNGSTFPSFTRRVRALCHPPRGGFFHFSMTTRHRGVWLRSLHPSDHTTSSGAWKKESWESGIQRVSGSINNDFVIKNYLKDEI